MGELINIKIAIKENINLKELIEKIKNELDTKKWL